MLTAIDPLYIIYVLAAGSLILAGEAIYLTCFSTASYRTRVNRRLRLMNDQPDRESILIQLRRERGLSSEGNYSLPLQSLNRLLLQSGLTIGFSKLCLFALVAAGLSGAAVFVLRGNATEAAIVTVLVGLVGPYGLLRFRRRRRHGRFGEQFPDAIDIIVRSLRAGHPVPVAVSMVAREMPDPIGTEFGIAADEITYGADLETAMRNLFYRVGQEDLPLFVTAVAIQSSTGGNLSEILQNLSSVIRLRFKMRRKVRALAAEGRFSALFLSGLPVGTFVLLRVVVPEFYDSVWDQPMTKVGLGCAAAWMIAGNLFMYRMVNFRI
jgi:tight adherence protein B